MATFRFNGRDINIHWNGYDIKGPSGTVFSIPDQLYEEFESDIRPAEPTLQWIDINEFSTLQSQVPRYFTAATTPIAINSSTDSAGLITKTWSLSANYSTDTHLHTGTYQTVGSYSTSTHLHTGTYQPSGTYVTGLIGGNSVSVAGTTSVTVGISSGTSGNGYLLTADGSGGAIWNPASTSGITSVVGSSPIATTISGGVVTVSLNANYQTAGNYQAAGNYQTSGNYATAVSATSPITATFSTAGLISISIDSALTVAESASRTRSRVRNSTASTIAKGSFVYIDGSNGTVPTIQKALADADATSARTFGIVEADIASNTDGYVTNQGLITGIDTSAFADGAVLWLSPTTAGAATTTKPSGPNHGVLLGIVVKGGSVGAGSIYIFVKNGAELDEIHDVNIGTLVDGQALIWVSANSVWQNKVLPVTSVEGTSPISTSTTSAGVVSISHVTSGATASTYGSSTTIPIITINNTGHITSASTTAITVPTEQAHNFLMMGA